MFLASEKIPQYSVFVKFQLASLLTFQGGEYHCPWWVVGWVLFLLGFFHPHSINFVLVFITPSNRDSGVGGVEYLVVKGQVNIGIGEFQLVQGMVLVWRWVHLTFHPQSGAESIAPEVKGICDILWPGTYCYMGTIGLEDRGVLGLLDQMSGCTGWDTFFLPLVYDSWACRWHVHTPLVHVENSTASISSITLRALPSSIR